MKFNLVGLICLVALVTFVSGCDQEKKEINNLKLARFYLEQGNDKLALEVLATELKENKNSLEVHSLMGEILNTAEYYGEAVQHYNLALELGCKQICVVGLMDAYIGQGEYQLAEQIYTGQVSDKKSAGSKYRSTLIDFQKSKNYQQAIDRLNSIDYPASADKVLELMFEQGRFAEVIDLYKEDGVYSENRLLVFAKTHYLLKQYNKTEEILLVLNLKRASRLLTNKKIQAVDLLVKTNLALNKIGDAELIYNTFLKNNEGTSYVTFQNALTQLGRSDFDAAISEMKTLAKNNPENVQVAQIIAMAHYGKNDFQAAINDLEPLKSKLDGRSLALLAQAYNKIGRPQDAIETLENSSSDNESVITLARAYFLKNDKQKALSVIKPVPIVPENNVYNLELADLWFDLGLYKKIIAGFSESTRQPAKIKYLVVNSYLRLNRPGAAKQYVKNQPDIGQSTEMLGYLEVVSGNLNGAIQIYKDLVLKKPIKKNYLLLASAYMKNKNYADTLQTIQAGFAVDGNDQMLLILASRMLSANNSAKVYEWLDSIRKEHRDYKLLQKFLANHDISQNQNEKAIKRLASLEDEADNQILLLIARAKGDSDPAESVRLMEQSLNNEFSLKVASLLHAYYIKTRDRDSLRRINTQIEHQAGINLRTANLLRKGYLALKQYDKSSQLADMLIAQGRSQSGQELKGDILTDQGKYSEAASLYKRLLDGDSRESLLVKYFTVKLAANTSDTKKTLAEAENRLAKNPEMHVLRNFIGVKYIDKDNKSAIKHLQILAKKFPDDIVLLNNLAWANLDLNPGDALKYSEKAYRAYADNDSIVDTYVRALVKNNRTKTAKKVLASRLEKNPGNQDLQNLMRSLN